MIIMYILFKAGKPILTLFGTIKMIYSVSLQSQKFSEAGYCVSTLEMCLECIMGEDADVQVEND